MLLAAIALLLIVTFAHSYLGERYILIRLFRQPLPRLFGSDDFTRLTLRFAWHITGVAWLGFAAVLAQIQVQQASTANLLLAIGVTFGVTGLIALIASRGRHLSWIVFGAVTVLCLASV